MSSPLKNVSTKDIEGAIAEALANLCVEKKGMNVNIAEMKFNDFSGSVSMSLTASRKLEPFEEVFGAS